MIGRAESDGAGGGYATAALALKARLAGKQAKQ